MKKISACSKRLSLPCIYTFLAMLFIVAQPIFSFGQQDSTTSMRTITGVVMDTLSQPLPGASVIEKGTTNGTQTDVDGKFSLTVSDVNAALVISFVGYEKQAVSADANNELVVTLRSEPELLEEVTVIGYGTVRKSDLTGSVAQVNSKEISAYPATTVMQSLQGRAPGVQVYQSTGAPGAAVSVRIRGSNSIQGNNDPLYVIDGFLYSGNPTNLNNADIESIEILKDASATAIYGSRGANGVVLITTKHGHEGSTKVDFETSYSMQKARSKLDLLNGQEYASFMNLQAQNDKKPTAYFTPEQVNGFGQGFDWQDFVFQQGAILSNSINVSGGNANTKFSLGGSVFNNQGIIKGSDYNRYSLRANIDHMISKKVSINWSNSFSYLDTKRKDSDGGRRGNSLIGSAIAAAPISQAYNENGSYTDLANAYPFIAPDIINPVNFINEQSNEVKANVTLSNLAVSYSPITDVTIKITGGFENRDDRTDAYTSRKFYKSSGFASVTTSQYRSLLNENTINYSKTFREKHNVSALAGFTIQNFKTTYLAGSGTGFLSDAFQSNQLQTALTPGIASSGFAESYLLSYLARINYAFNNKYLLTLSMRRDGSSKYSDGNKWGNFPSAAVAWKATEEEFIKNMNLFSTLKIRASWGLTGSQAINPYTTLNTLYPGRTVFDDKLFNTLAPGTRLPGNLKWETTTQINVGIDMGFFDNRFSVTADYYKKNTTDLLNTVNLPTSTGYVTTIQNIGEIQNQGVELGLSAAVLTKAFKWDLSVNISGNRNKVIKLNDGEDVFTAPIDVLVVKDNLSILREGRPLGQFWGYQEDGYDEKGQIKIKDLSGDGEISAEDKTYIGDPNPKFIYGINSDMSYKNFTLSFFIQGSQGNDIFNVSAIPVTMDYGQGLNTLRSVYLDNWSPSNPNAKYPIISRNTSAYASDRWVEDGSYGRLKNIELGYSIPIKKTFIQSAQIYISGQNLVTLTGYSWWDPEVNSQGADAPGIDYLTYPTPKSYTAGLRLSF